MSNFTKETTANSRIIVLDESGYDGSCAESEEGKKRLSEIKELLKGKHFGGYINPEDIQFFNDLHLEVVE